MNYTSEAKHFPLPVVKEHSLCSCYKFLDAFYKLPLKAGLIILIQGLVSSFKHYVKARGWRRGVVTGWTVPGSISFRHQRSGPRLPCKKPGGSGVPRLKAPSLLNHSAEEKNQDCIHLGGCSGRRWLIL